MECRSLRAGHGGRPVKAFPGLRLHGVGTHLGQRIVDIQDLAVVVAAASGTDEKRFGVSVGQRPAVFRLVAHGRGSDDRQVVERARGSHAPAVGAGVVNALVGHIVVRRPQLVGTAAPKPVVVRVCHTRNKDERVPDGIFHRSGLGARLGHFQVDATAAAAVHRGTGALRALVGIRPDERVFAAPLVI